MQADLTAHHFDPTDKVISVTGGSRGLGFEMCRACCQSRLAHRSYLMLQLRLL